MSVRIKPSFVIALLLQHLVVIDGVRTVDMSEGSVARSSSSDALSSRVTVRETETPLVSIHFSIKPSEMQKMLGDRLVPDVYDGKAFIQVSMFYITTLEMQSFLGFVPSLMSSWCMRISAYVKMKDSGEKGYVILSADFESSISGKIMTSGCKSSQLGTLCGTIAVNRTKMSYGQSFTVKQDGNEILHLAAQLGNVSNTPFFNWANERYVRFQLSADKKTLKRGTQPKETKIWEGNYQVKLAAGAVDPIWSKVFETKFAGYGWAYLDDPVPEPCGQGWCFFSSKAAFVDNEATVLAVNDTGA